MTKRIKFSIAVLTGMLAAASAQAACYTVMDAKGAVISQTSTPPVDMSQQLHQTVPMRYGSGASMVFGIADPSCGPEAEPYAGAALKPVTYRQTRARKGKRARRAPKADRG